MTNRRKPGHRRIPLLDIDSDSQTARDRQVRKETIEEIEKMFENRVISANIYRTIAGLSTKEKHWFEYNFIKQMLKRLKNEEENKKGNY